MLHQKVTDKFPTMEWLALAQIRKQFPELHRKGFMAAVRAAFSRESSEELPRISIVPDGWVETRPGAFVCIEVEDQHLLSPGKLWRYCRLFNLLDACDPPDYGLRLFVFDRYGHNERELVLSELYLHSLG
jgi:hypothetical protein